MARNTLNIGLSLRLTQLNSLDKRSKELNAKRSQLIQRYIDEGLANDLNGNSPKKPTSTKDLLQRLRNG